VTRYTCLFLADHCCSSFYGHAQEVANILANGVKLREYTKGVENNIRQIELDSIQVSALADVIYSQLRFHVNYDG
jgi:hypothetical protein